MEKLTFIFLWLIIIASTIIIVTGYAIGERYEGSKEIYLDYGVPYVWEALTDFENIKEGKSDVKSVETIGTYYNLYAWKENLKNGGFRKFRQVKKEEKKELILELTESNYGVTGAWRFSLIDENHGTRVVIEEKSTNKSIMRRGILYYFDRGLETTIWNKYLRVRLFNKLLTTP